MLSRVEQAALNNALWCDAVCRAHNSPGAFFDTVWLNRHPAPRFYPNVVTLAGKQAAAAQHAQVLALLESGLPGSWGVKDSFATLDLAKLNFQIVIEGAWIWRPPSGRDSAPAPDQLRWERVQSTSELSRWETAWNREPMNSLAGPQSRLFMPALLTNPDIAFMAAYRDNRIIAGAIANRTDNAVGLSNIFGPEMEQEVLWADCIAAVEDRFPGLALVGYQRGAELAVAQSVGFEPIHDLRVWIRQAQ